MPKFNYKNQDGESAGRQIFVIAAIIVIAALMIVAVFITLNNRAPAPSGSTEDFLKNIERTRQERNQKTETAPTAAAPLSATYAGVLIEINNNTLVLAEKDTQNKITLALDDQTPITYNGQAFSRSRFYVGDQLQIVAKKSAGAADDSWQAESIIVLLSASPATAAPVPPAANVRPDGSIKPL